MGGTAGLLIAAGAGSRFGGAKALARTPSGRAWVEIAVRTLLAGGCDRVAVVLGASADEARALVPVEAAVVVAEHWRRGMSASLIAGLEALAATDADLAVVTLGDLPGLPAEAVRRVLDAADGPAALARAVYSEVPGHPVVLGREHWAAFRTSLHGDEGGRRWLEQHGVQPVECGDLFSGRDVDRR